ncbi:family 78 glycoside hydrolase catalytic domain [Paenibacillus solisilvae]|uniref:Family 78 glycoside hydrolase catalytic domain n=1 Tax=Paenibacillus solisilvae TaxID=2486751 RepID=A0ABW0VX23_9BACL
MLAETKWQASWIWGGEEASTRNEWRCFYKSIEVPESGWDEAIVSITADSRFVIYINGVQCGRGPVRSWPSEQRYARLDVGHLLKRGQPNSIAVLVTHFGVSTFQYLLGRGGLLAQLELTAGESSIVAAKTDASWMTAVHGAHERRVSRMSCQLGFSEQFDSRNWDEDWILKAGSAPEWSNAHVVAAAGTEPWPALLPADIPPLTEETLWPVRVESLKKVKPVSWTGHFDIRNAMVPESKFHANQTSFAGYAAVIIRASEEAGATIGYAGGFGAFVSLGLNGKRYMPDELTGEEPQRYLDVQLHQGDNVLWFETTGGDHGGGLHIGIDCAKPFELVSLLTGKPERSPFTLVGPFASMVHIDHQENDSPLLQYRGFGGDKELDAEAFDHFDSYLAFRGTQSLEQFAPYRSLAKPFPEELAAVSSVFMSCIWKRSSESCPVPSKMQNIVIPGPVPGIIPNDEDTDTEFIIDFGKERSGYIRFEIDAAAGTVIDFYGFEYMRDGWRQDTYGLDNVLRYTCREGRQSYESPVRRGFRYLMVTVRGASRPAKLYGVQVIQSHYPVAEIGRFHSSDPLLNDIWEISKYTTKLCMEDTFVDCPAYEQAFWVGDSRNEALVNYYVFGEADIVKRCLKLVPGSKHQSPLYADQVPSGWSSVIPNWTFFWAIAVLEYVGRTGDRQFAAEIWPDVRFTLDHYLQKLDERGLLFIRGWNLLDWAPIDQPGNGVVTHQNAIFAQTLRAAAELSALAGAEEQGASFAKASQDLIDAINLHLWSDDKQAYLDCIHADGTRSETFSMQTQVIAFLNGVASGLRRETIASYLDSPPEDFVQIGSPFMAFFYYEALASEGKFMVMLDNMRKHFGEMIEYEATTCWEMYPNFKENRANPNLLTRSHCHAWSAAPGYFLGAYVLGVTGTADGWQKVRVSPQPGDLKWARGAVPLPDGGRVDVSWRIEDTGAEKLFHLEVRAPRDIEVELAAPQGYCSSLHRLEI